MIKKCDQIINQLRSVPVWLWLTGILLFSFLLKVLCWYLDPVVSLDGCLYIRLAQIWHNTDDFQGVLNAWNDFWIPPMLLYLMKNLMDLGLSAEMAGVLLNLTAGTFTPLLTYGIAWEIMQRKDIAICSALLIAVNPSMNALSTEVQRDRFKIPARQADIPEKEQSTFLIVSCSGHILLDNVEFISNQITTKTEVKQ